MKLFVALVATLSLALTVGCGKKQKKVTPKATTPAQTSSGDNQDSGKNKKGEKKGQKTAGQQNPQTKTGKTTKPTTPAKPTPTTPVGKKPSPKKPEPKKPGTKKPEPKKPSPKNPEPKKPEPKKPEPKKPEPKKPEPKKPEPKKPEPKKPEPKKPEPKEPTGEAPNKVTVSVETKALVTPTFIQTYKPAQKIEVIKDKGGRSYQCGAVISAGKFPIKLSEDKNSMELIDTNDGNKVHKLTRTAGEPKFAVGEWLLTETTTNSGMKVKVTMIVILGKLGVRTECAFE